MATVQYLDKAIADLLEVDTCSPKDLDETRHSHDGLAEVVVDLSALV